MKSFLFSVAVAACSLASQTTTAFQLPAAVTSHRAPAFGLGRRETTLFAEEKGDEPESIIVPETDLGGDGETKSKTTVKYMNSGKVGDVDWNDPYMVANTDVSQTSLLSWALVGLPAILLLDDVFHFLPEKLKII